MFKKSIVFLVLLSSLLGGVYYFLAAKYPYDVRRDHRYSLENSDHQMISVDVEDGVFSIGDVENWDTGFIRLKVSATLAGFFAEPSVEIVSDTHQSILTLERGVHGERLINLSNLSVGTRHDRMSFQLIGHYLDIPDQQAEVVFFSNVIMQNHPRVLVVAPHPDDAEIAAFGLYSAFESFILTITAGEAGEFMYDEIYSDRQQHFVKKGQIRVWNSITVPLLGGVLPEHAVNLGYFDATLQVMAENKGQYVHSLYTGIKDVNFFRRQNISSMTPSSKGGADWQSLVTDIETILLSFDPDIIVTPYPAIDTHLDHKYSTAAVIEAIKKCNRRQGQLFLYTNHPKVGHYFPYGQQGELAPVYPDFDNYLYFDGIYSLSLTQPLDKVLALESMNDLRLDTEWLTIRGAAKVLSNAIHNRLMLNDTTYFRRAVRANEMFLVVNESSLYSEEILHALFGGR